MRRRALYNCGMTRKGPVPLSADLARCLEALDIPQVSLLASLHKAWPGIVGPLLSGKAVPGRFRNGVLTIVVRNHAWAQELQMRKTDLLSRIVAATGPKSPVAELRFAVGDVASPEERGGGAPEDEPETAGPDPEGRAEGADPEMRESLRAISRRLRPRAGGRPGDAGR